MKMEGFFSEMKQNLLRWGFWALVFVGLFVPSWRIADITVTRPFEPHYGGSVLLV
jgi:hypothetical protein